MQRNFFHQNNSVENIKLTVEEKNIQTDSQLIYGLKSSSVLTFVTRKCRIAAQYPKIRKINHHYFETRVQEDLISFLKKLLDYF